MIKLDCNRIIKNPVFSCYWLAYPGTRTGTSHRGTGPTPFPLIDGNICTDHGLMPDNKVIIVSIQRVLQFHRILNIDNTVTTIRKIESKLRFK